VKAAPLTIDDPAKAVLHVLDVARIVTTVSEPEKTALARTAGADPA
jgi:hypothetical protein